MTERVPDWRNRSLYLPHLFLTLVLPWGAFALLFMGRAIDFVQPLFYFYLVAMVSVFGVGIMLIKERPSPKLYQVTRLMPMIAAVPAFGAVALLIARMGG